MRLSKRIAAIEAANAPALQRARKRRQTLEHFFNITKVDFDEAFRLAQYVGEHRTHEQFRISIGEHFLISIGEHFLLSLAQCVRMYKGITQLTPEQIHEAQARASVLLVREWYGREITLDESRREQEICEQARADFEAGIPPDESEAAMYLRNLFAQYPLLKNQSDALTAYLAGVDMEEWHKQYFGRYE